MHGRCEIVLVVTLLHKQLICGEPVFRFDHLRKQRDDSLYLVRLGED